MCIEAKTSKKTCSLDTIGINLSLEQKSTNQVRERFDKKRQAKSITKGMMHKLFHLQNSPMLDQYRQAYVCNEYLFQDGKKVTSNYCSKRCCMVCSRIRSKQMVEDYMHQILSLNDIHMVSLTNKNVPIDQLENEVNYQVHAFTKIKNNLRKSKAYKHLNMSGFRSMECTYNHKSKEFNPHIHLVVSGKDTANEIVRQWLVLNPKADIKGQEATEMYGGESGLRELFKYIAKPITNGYYSTHAYDAIMNAYKGVRVYQSFGTIRKNPLKENDGDIDETKLKASVISWKGERIEVWKWIDEVYDWVAPDGELFMSKNITDKQRNTLNVIERTETITDEKIDTLELFKQARPRGKDEILF